MRLIKIILKNFKLLFRSKSTLLVILIAPLLLIILGGLAFNNAASLYQIKIGSYSPDYSEVSESILSSLEQRSFQVFKVSSEQECIDGVRLGFYHVCMQFSENISIHDDMHNQVSLFVDHSEYNLAWVVLESVSTEVSSKSQEVTTSLTDSLLQKIRVAQEGIQYNQELLADLFDSHDIQLTIHTNLEDNLSSQDLSFDASNYDFDLLSTNADIVQNRVDILFGDINKTLISLQKKIPEVAPNKTLRQPLLLQINETLARASTMRSQLEQRNVNITQVVTDMQMSLSQLQSQLSTSESLRLFALDDLDSLKTALSKDLDNLNSLERSLSGINSELTSLVVSDAASISSPITTNIYPVSTEKTHFNYMLPSLIMLFIMFISILLASTLVITEKNSKAFIRNVLTPTKDIYFILATFITALLTVLIQLILLLAAASLFLQFPLDASFFLGFVSMLIFSSFFILFGMVLGYLFKSEESVMVASISSSALFLILSGLILPLETMPTAILKYAGYSPFVLGEAVLKMVFLFGMGLPEIIRSLALVSLYAVFMVILIFVFHGFLKKRYVFVGNKGKLTKKTH